MKFNKTKLKDAFVIDLEKIKDNRGFFGRAYCNNEFKKFGLKNEIVQCNISQNHYKGTLRGMHFQRQPYEEVKMVRCISGSIYDVIIDLRKNSPTYMEWTGVTLSEKNFKMFYVPEGFAHGYQTLEDNTIVYYQVTEFYQPGAEGGIRWNDATFDIDWPLPVSEISEKDKSYSDFEK